MVNCIDYQNNGLITVHKQTRVTTTPSPELLPLALS